MKFFGILLLLLLLAVGAAAYIVYTPYGPSSETFVDIPPGTGATAIATLLRKNGIIRSRYAFALLRLTRNGTFKAGEYRFDHPVPPAEVYDRLIRGDVYTQSLTIPEGYNIFDIANAVEAAGFAKRDAFLAAERQHTELIADLLPPGTHPDSLEGYLFPDTYRFSRHATPPMASVIEKEVAQKAERPLVAGVFTNRLAKSMPLGTDPTVIYAALLDNRWRGTIYASDLQSPSPYNTYKHTGLPPGPISNPGLASLRAAIHPAQTDYLYFVSDAAGHTRFSVDLKEHAQQVQAYRQAEKH